MVSVTTDTIDYKAAEVRLKEDSLVIGMFISEQYKKNSTVCSWQRERVVATWCSLRDSGKAKS